MFYLQLNLLHEWYFLLIINVRFTNACLVKFCSIYCCCGISMCDRIEDRKPARFGQRPAIYIVS